jgi:hypothetical protein
MKIKRCDFCKSTKNPAYEITDRKTGKIVKRVCRNCISNFDKVFTMLQKGKTEVEEMYREAKYNDGINSQDFTFTDEDIPF